MKKMDVVALGELLIDFTQNGMSEQGNLMFEANPGGAPCNVLAMLNNLGKKTGFIGKVGDDFFGHMLGDTVEKLGIDVSGLYYDKDVRTTLALVHTKEDGDRDFSFYRNPGADMMLTVEELNEGLLKNTRIFQCGTLSMTHDKVREATYKAIQIAKDAGAVFTFDPNLRPPLWNSQEEAKKQIAHGMQLCDVLKISDNEVEFMTGESDIVKGVEILKGMTSAKLICATAGKDGSYAFCGGRQVYAPGVKVEHVVDTTGAGDTFCACMINYVLDHGMDLTEEQMKEMLVKANQTASMITAKKGALRVMPTVEEIEKAFG